MRVLVLTSTFPRWKGDTTPEFVYDFARRLQGNGTGVVALAPHHGGAKKREEMGGVKVYRFPYFYPHRYQRLVYDGGILPNLKRSTLAKVQAPLLVMAELFSTLLAIRKEKIDVVNSHWIVPQGLVGAMCRKLAGTPHVATLHSSELTALKKLPFGQTIAGFVVRNSDAVVSVSAHRAEELIGFLPPEARDIARARLRIIPMGVDTRWPVSIADKNTLKAKHSMSAKKIILFVGRLIDVKGCEYLIRGFKDVATGESDAILLIVGSGPLMEPLKNLAADLGIAGSVRFEGYVVHDLISEYYAMADMVVLPSIEDESGYREGLPVTLVEAMAMCRPVIAARTRGVMEVVTDQQNGILVEPKDAIGLGKAILSLLEDGSLAATLSGNAAETAKKYDWSIIAGKYDEVLQSINK